MANYSSYKKIHGDQLLSNVLGASSFSQSPNCTYGVKWVYGIMCRCSPGCCCNWTVPSGVQNCGFRLGVLVETVLVHVHVTDVITGKLLKVDTTTLK